MATLTRADLLLIQHLTRSLIENFRKVGDVDLMNKLYDIDLALAKKIHFMEVGK